jgi:hypothetical protein
MLKRAVVLAVVLTMGSATWAAAQAPAQVPAPAGRKAVTFGVKGGVTVSTISGAGDAELPEGVVSSTSSRTGFIAGGSLLVAFTGALGIQTEVLYTQKGATSALTMTSGGATAAVNATVRLSYIEVPVLFRYTAGQPGKARPFVYAGPSVAFKVGAHGSGTASGGGMSQSLDEDLSDEINGVDAGIAIGGGVEFGRLTVDARFTEGLVNVFKVANGGFKNRTFVVMAGVRF